MTFVTMTNKITKYPFKSTHSQTAEGLLFYCATNSTLTMMSNDFSTVWKKDIGGHYKTFLQYNFLS